MAGFTVRKIGTSVEIRVPDVALFNSAAAQAVLTAKARQFFELALAELAGHISDAAPIGVSGNLAQSFAGAFGSTMGGSSVTGSSLEEIQGRVFSSLPYAIVIDQGRAPGARMPPPDALVPWVKRVLQVGGSEEEVRSVAFIVARAIGRKGIKARNFVAAGITAATPRLEGIFQIMGEAMAVGLTESGGAGGASGA